MRQGFTMMKRRSLVLVAFLQLLIATILGSVQYLVIGIATARTDPNGGVDNWTLAPDAGIDCTGTNDARVAFQAAINGMPDAGTIKFPIGCKVKLGIGVTSGQCALTIADRVGVQFTSEVLVGNFAEAKPHKYSGLERGGTAFCFHHVDHPRIIGLSMQVVGAGNFDFCIVFDGDPVKHIGTAGVVDHFVCNNGSNTNSKVYWNFDFPNDCKLSKKITKSLIAFLAALLLKHQIGAMTVLLRVVAKPNFRGRRCCVCASPLLQADYH